MSEYKLRPIYDSHKDFYGKATVQEYEYGNNHFIKVLTSYQTQVAAIRDNKPEVYGTYSATTLRHIKEFLLQNGFKAESKAQIIKDYESKEDLEIDKNIEATDNLKMVSNVMALGDIFSNNQTDSNNWKARMLKAGIPEGALHMPEDWNTLSEDVKTSRLNAVIAALEES